jgi:hypothetical protein
MLIQRLVADTVTNTGHLVIETNPEDANSLAELTSLQQELGLRPNIRTEGSIITNAHPEQPPMPDVG